MFHPEDKENLDLMTGGVTSADLLNEYTLRLRYRCITGGRAPLGVDHLIGILRHLGIEPPDPSLGDGPVNWREIAMGTPVREKSTGRIGEFVQLVSQGSVAVRFEGVIEELLPRGIELGPPAMPVEITEDPMDEEAGDKLLPLESPDWRKTKVGDELYVRIEGDMHDVTLKSRLPGKDRCTVVLEGEEKVLLREQVFLPV